jgi:hypothetical protein
MIAMSGVIVVLALLSIIVAASTIKIAKEYWERWRISPTTASSSFTSDRRKPPPRPARRDNC